MGLAARAAALCQVFGALLGIPRPAGAATRSCGCGQSPPVAAGLETTIAIHVADYPDARDGSYLLYVPAGYDSETPMPLLLGFHGWTSSPSVLRQTSGLETSADSHGFVPAFLEGVDDPEAGRGWAFPGCNASPAVGQTDALGRRAVCSSGDTYSCDASTCPSTSCADQCGCDATQCQCVMNQGSNCNWCGCVNDEAFARAVLDDVSKRLCVDLDRVYATGMSAGGMITSWLSGRAHDVFAAFVPVSGTDPRDFYDLPPADSDAGVMWIHGTQDNTVPHDGSPASNGYFYEAASAEAQRVAAAYECDASPSAWPVPASVNAPASAQLSCSQHANCPEATQGAGAREVAYCFWKGGHTWPKAGGFQESALWGNRLMMEFLLRHSRDAAAPSCGASPPVPSTRQWAAGALVFALSALFVNDVTTSDPTNWAAWS